MGEPNSREWTDKALDIIRAAENYGKDKGHSTITPYHIAYALFNDLTAKENSQAEEGESKPTPLFRLTLEKAGADVGELELAIEDKLKRQPRQDQRPDSLTAGNPFLQYRSHVFDIADMQKAFYIAIDHLIEGICAWQQTADMIRTIGKVEPTDVAKMLRKLRADIKFDSQVSDDQGATSGLEAYCTDVTARAREGKIDPVIGRDKEVRTVIQILSRRTKNNPILIGEPGVGKTTIAEGLAIKINDGEVPDSLKGCKLLSLDVGALVAGASYKGQFEERMKTVLKGIESSKETILLFVDEIHLLMGAGSAGGGGMDAANLLKPALARGQLHCIGATTLAEHRQYIEKDEAFNRRFQQVLVDEPDHEATVAILRGLKEKFETYHGVTITDGAINAAAQLARRYLTTRRLPDSAVDLIDGAAASVRVTRESQPEELEKLELQLRQLKIEIHALSRETEGKDPKSVERLRVARKEERELKAQIAPLKAKYESEKRITHGLQKAKEKLESLKNRLKNATQNGDYERAADLQRYAIPDAEQVLEELEAEKAAATRKRALEGGDDNLLLSDEVGAEQIAELVGRWTGIPVAQLKASEQEKLLQMENILNRAVVGQKTAVKSLTEAIQCQRAGTSNPNQPPSFLFCGPSGTGKTLLAKTLAKFLFNDPKSMIRFDMSEYQERHALSRLIGAPPGYVGHDAGGQLTEALRRKPFSILLFDEIEKACKEILTVLLQLMDDGRITDGQGRVIDAKNCIVIMTSNLGASYLLTGKKASKKIPPATRELVMQALRDYFLPEFLNRISSVVIFNRLTEEGIRKIVDVNLKEIHEMFQKNGKNYVIQVDEAAKDHLGKNGYDGRLGARPLNRLIKNELQVPLAKLILSKQVLEGETVRVGLRGGHLWVKPNHTIEAPPVEDDDDSSDDDDDEEEDEDEQLYE